MCICIELERREKREIQQFQKWISKKWWFDLNKRIIERNDIPGTHTNTNRHRHTHTNQIESELNILFKLDING